MCDKPTVATATNMTVDIKKAILAILDNSDQSYRNWLNSDVGHGYVRQMHTNETAIRAILDAIKEN
jgi:hypothetical protein